MHDVWEDGLLVGFIVGFPLAVPDDRLREIGRDTGGAGLL
jgi:hypothetical protein